MPDFRLRTYRPDKGFQSVTLSAADVGAARKTVEHSGFKVIDARPVLARGAWRRWRDRRAFSLELFTEELLTLLDAGLNLIEAVSLISRKQRNPQANRVLEALKGLLSRGLSFSAALESIPDVFPVLYVATVRSSERTGDLCEALRRYLTYRMQINRVRDKVVAASVYPVLLITISSLLLIFLLVYVVPRFSMIYEDLGDRTPFASRMMIEWSSLIANHGTLLVVGILVGGAVVATALMQVSIRSAVLRYVWSVPGIGERMRIYQLARFTRTLAMLYSGGIAFVPALGIVGDLLNQPALREGLERAKRVIAEGVNVAAAFEVSGLSTETATRMLVVGERSGELGSMLAKIADMYDLEVARSVEWFSRLLEPALMIVVGAVIGTVILLMYLPIVELANIVQ